MDGAGKPDPRITWIVDYMHRHLDQALPTPRLAELVNLSESRFRALFVAQTGLAPATYLHRLRLRRARILLERTFLSVKEVMALVGYNDASHFTRDFRRAHGVAPSTLRRTGTGTPSVDWLTNKQIGRPRGRDPGRCSA